MWPELGKYAGAVLSAYGVTIVLLGLLIAVSLLNGRRVKKELEEIEARIKKNG